jgi:hypothetical protein
MPSPIRFSQVALQTNPIGVLRDWYNFPTMREYKAYMEGSAFAKNPLGVEFDPEKLAARFRAGVPAAELLRSLIERPLLLGCSRAFPIHRPLRGGILTRTGEHGAEPLRADIEKGAMDGSQPERGRIRDDPAAP